MADKNERLYGSIVAWINKLKAHGVHKEETIKQLLDMKDGILLSALYNYAVPENYRLGEESLYRDHNDNWAFTLKNLNTLFDAMQNYCHTVLQKQLHDIEFLSIFNEDNKQAMLQLVSDVISVLLSNECKNECITAIMELEEDDQERLSHFIKRLLSDKSITSSNRLDTDGNRLDTDASYEDITGNTMNHSISDSESKQRLSMQLLKKIDELEQDQQSEKKKYEQLKLENGQLKAAFQEQSKLFNEKEEENMKLLLQRDQFLMSAKAQSFEEVIMDIKNQKNLVLELNKQIDAMEAAHKKDVKELKDEIEVQERRLEKFKNYEKVVDTVRTLGEENKYLEKRLLESERDGEEARKKVADILAKAQDKEENGRKKYETKQLLQRTIELETQLGTKTAECLQLTTDVTELQHLTRQQDEQIQELTRKVTENMKTIALLNSSSSQSSKKNGNIGEGNNNNANNKNCSSFKKLNQKRPLSSDFNEVMNKLAVHEWREKIGGRNIVDDDQKILSNSRKDENGNNYQIEKKRTRSEEKDLRRSSSLMLLQDDYQGEEDGLTQHLTERISQLQDVIAKSRQRREKEEVDKRNVEGQKLKLMQELAAAEKNIQKITGELTKQKKLVEFNKLEAEDQRQQLQQEIKLLVSVITDLAQEKGQQNS